jgi:hypothetical protein
MLFFILRCCFSTLPTKLPFIRKRNDPLLCCPATCNTTCTALCFLASFLRFTHLPIQHNNPIQPDSSQELGLSPGPRTYAGMVTACAPPHGQPQPELAKKLIARMRRDGFSGPATLKPYNALLRVICLSDGVDAAEAVLYDMHHVGAVPDVATWTTLRAVALKQNRIDVAERADRELRALRQRGTHRRGFEVDGGDAGDREAEEETAVVAGESEVGGKKLKEKDSMDNEEGEEGRNQADAGGLKEKHWKSFYASDDEDEW